MGDLPCVQLTSYLEGSPLMWMMLLHLHINLMRMMMMVVMISCAFVFAFAKSGVSHEVTQIEPRHEKTNILYMRKQRRRSALQ